MILKSKNARGDSRYQRDIVIIILVFVLLALAIWKWFDYRIARLHYGDVPSSIHTPFKTEAPNETL